MGQQFTLAIDSDVKHLAQVAEFVENLGREFSLNDDQLYDVQMAVDEAVTNVIEHAYRGKRGGIINIECGKHGKELTIVIQDFGEPFDPKKVKIPKTHAPLSERNIGGLGLFFMQKMMDKVEFDFSPATGNRLTMVKKLKR